MIEPEKVPNHWPERLSQLVGSEGFVRINSPEGLVEIKKLQTNGFDGNHWSITAVDSVSIDTMKVEQYELCEGKGLVSFKLKYIPPCTNVANINTSEILGTSPEYKEVIILDEQVPEELRDRFNRSVDNLMQFIETVVVSADDHTTSTLDSLGNRDFYGRL